MSGDVGTWPIGDGLCARRDDHAPHMVECAQGWPAGYWCHADQSRRLPAYGRRFGK